WMNKEEMWGLKTQDIEETYYLSNQYLSFKNQPGSFFDLLKHSKKTRETKSASDKIILKDIIKSLSSLTGLPENILDDGERLNLNELEEHFNKKVIGQEDAVKTLSERIAMIKAGLTDPSKPSGVFLFVGPTGTGKTEIAKALANYLFGSEDRLLRLDMSEFQTADSISKILGDTSDISESAALVNLIRRNPFSVILLDEFEKAHANIWDLFLQVFDDGRLTDQKGTTADFRHSIIILTSNLGASVPTSSKIGFGSNQVDREIDSNVMKSINQTFRPEFINRLDKIVVFNPLTKSVAKTILKSELKKVLHRRGIRRRGWELDFEDSALDFLLHKGFSSTLGARPLKRAVEKYLLAPLAETIVNHSFPEGNQFLLVGATREKLKVDFIDPDEPDLKWDQKQRVIENQISKIDKLSLQEIILEPRGTLSEFKFIKKKLTDLKQLISELGIATIKDAYLLKMAESEFWNSKDRYLVLSDVEYIDRVESAFETADNLFNRLNVPGKERVSYDANLIKRIAERTWLLTNSLMAYAGNLHQDALLLIQFAEQAYQGGLKITAMYESWAKKRGMDVATIEDVTHAGEITKLLSITGFGAYQILKGEAGYHVVEEYVSSDNIRKTKVKVIALPMELEDYRAEKISRDRFNQYLSQKSIRRYQIKKSPLVKDIKNKWQTGKIDKVLSGDFDLFNISNN
ncbi:MAG: AAA family ATPase, partial [Cyanobacteria bacterium P01_F01_bin.143]